MGDVSGVRRRSIRVGRQLWLLLVALGVLTGSARADDKRVLILQSVDRGNLTLDYLTGNFRVDMDALAAFPVTFVQFTVNPAGFGASPQEAVIEFLRQAFSDRPQPDLVVTLGGPAAVFAKQHRRELFPETPLLLAGVDRQFLTSVSLADNEAAVAVANDFPGLIDDILELLPDTSTVFVVMGSGELSRFWRQQMEQDFQRFAPRVTFIWSNALSYPEILQHVATLPPRSAVFHYNFGTDGQGGAYSEERVLADLQSVANAPVFGSQSAQLGHGIVGGRLMATDVLGRSIAGAVLRLLNGEAASRVRIPIQRPGPPVFDWRQLQRWQIDPRRLPLASEIRYQPPGVWERFRWAILAGLSTLVAQAALIAALLVNRVKRRRAEASLREGEERFRVLANAAPVMIWMAGVDMTRADFNVPWLTFSGRTPEQERAGGWMEGVHPDDRSGVVRACAQALDRPAPFQLEYRLRRFDGEYRWILDRGEPRRLPGGAFVGYIGSAIDITDLKAARAAVSSLNRRLIDAQEQERSRVARELHDDVGQRLTLLSIELERLRTAMPELQADTRGRLIALNDAVSGLGKDVQAISHRLHSSKLELLGIAVAAGGLCRELAAQSGVAIEYLEHDVPARLPEGVALSLFRVLQEALSNAIKHANARHVHVVLWCGGDDLMLEVADDGRGFEVQTTRRRGGLGLVSMEERLRLLDGELTIASTPGEGTTLRARVPLPREHRPA